MKKLFSISVDVKRNLHAVSPMLFGLFIEDINFSCDGGLNANMVRNFSFDGVYLNRKRYSEFQAFVFKSTPNAEIDRLRYWKIYGGVIESLKDEPVAENSWYAQISMLEACRLENCGYVSQIAEHADVAMSIVSKKQYEFSCWIRSRNYSGDISVWVEDSSGKHLTDVAVVAFTHTWHQPKLLLIGKSTGYGKLVISFNGAGIIDLDGVSVMSTDTWGSDNPMWSQGKLRRDLVECLRDLKPRFLRFPGGCIVEGNGLGNEYNWKDTVGPIINRRPKYSLWGGHLKDGGYSQSFQVGFYEYFMLCEDLGMEPLPTLFAGLHCQFRSRYHLESGNDAFESQVLNQYLDLIEYANGDPGANRWAALRAEAGHPEPFGLKYIGIGNENYGPHYLKNFEAIKSAIHKKYPGITLILASGAFPKGKAFEDVWATARKRYRDVIVDEHCYNRPQWFIKNFKRYDHYDRNGPKVYMGEYAANFPLGIRPFALTPNCYQTALAEAVFLAGIERNSDVVVMSSYAPLFSMIEGAQWPHNLVNFNPSNILLTTNYFIQKMFSTTVGDSAIKIDGDAPKGVYMSATKTLDRLIIKIINTNPIGQMVEIIARDIDLSVPVYVEYLQSDNLQTANSMRFNGEPEYAVRPKKSEIIAKDYAFSMELQRYGVYVFVASLHQADKIGADSYATSKM